MIDWSRYPDFSERDFPAGDPQQGFLDKLQRARAQCPMRFIVNSGVRPGDPRAHGAGWAADLKCTDSRARYEILRALFAEGFHRIGVYDRHIHVDDWPEGPPRVVWWGQSQ